MANTFSPFGLRPFGRLEGGAPTAGQTVFILNSSDTNLYFTGDLVSLSTSGALTLPTSGITTGSTWGAPVAGVFNGCKYYNPNVGRVVWSSWFPGNLGTSSSPGHAYVITDPQQMFLIQGSSGAVLSQASVGSNFAVATSSATIQPLGNQLSGISAEYMLSSYQGGATTLPLRCVDIYSNRAPPGVNGTSTGSEGFQIAVVTLNNQIFKSLSGVSS